MIPPYTHRGTCTCVLVKDLPSLSRPKGELPLKACKAQHLVISKRCLTLLQQHVGKFVAVSEISSLTLVLPSIHLHIRPPMPGCQLCDQHIEMFQSVEDGVPKDATCSFSLKLAPKDLFPFVCTHQNLTAKTAAES